MSPTLAALVRAARQAWPAIAVDEAAFAAFIAQRVDDPSGLAPERAHELFLAFACSVGNRDALDAFDERYLARVPAWVARIDSGQALASEVQQMLRERLLTGTPPKIAEFRGAGSLEGWLRVAATRTALEIQRAGRRERLGDVVPDLASEWLDDPELDYLKPGYARELEVALGEALEALDDRDRAVLGMYLVDGLNIERIGKLYDVHRATVARWISAARDRLYDETRRRLGERLALGSGEFESIARLVRSQVNVSLRRILANQNENRSA